MTDLRQRGRYLDTYSAGSRGDLHPIVLLQRAGRGACRSATGMIGLSALIIARRGENVKTPGEKFRHPSLQGRTGMSGLRRSVLRLPGRSGGLHADSGTAPFPHGLLRNRSGRRVDHKAMCPLERQVPVSRPEKGSISSAPFMFDRGLARASLRLPRQMEMVIFDSAFS